MAMPKYVMPSKPPKMHPKKPAALSLVPKKHPSKPSKSTTTKSLMVPSPLPSADSKSYAGLLRLNTTYLQGCLPPGSRNLYRPRRYGNHLGVPCVCRECGDRPPSYIRPWNRWRWMSFHTFIRHALKKIPQVGED